MKLPVLLLSVLVISVSQAQTTDTIHAGDGQLQMKYLPTGMQRYLVYIETAEHVKKNIWLWERTATRAKYEGNEAIVIRQQWVTSDTGFNFRDLTSVVDPVAFTPIIHRTKSPRGELSFQLSTADYFSSDPVAEGHRKKAGLPPLATSFNWELDLETFALLPLAEGKAFVINFFQPGSKTQPAWYTYTVTGSEKLPTLNGESVDCYKLFTDYGNNRGYSTWWLSKKTHDILKMEEHFGSITRYKIRLALPG